MKRAVALAAAALGIALGASAGQASAPALILFSADRAPTVSGEVYRVDPNGHHVNLSKSPYQDLFPVVSPDGKHVAFVRDLVSTARVYEVGIRGRHPVAVGPPIPRPAVSGCAPTLAWQPGTSRLAVGVCGWESGKLWIVHRGTPTTFVSTAGLTPTWSPDGNVLIASSPSPHSGTVLRAYSSSGSPLWHAARSFPWEASWSSHNLLAVPSETGLTVYDEYGHPLSMTPGTVSGGPASSPNGQFVAFIAGRWLYVRTPSGEGVLVRKRFGNGHALAWDGNGHVAVGGYGSCACKAKVLNVRTGAVTPAKSGNWFEPRSADGKLAVVTPVRKPTFGIGVAPVGSSRAKIYSRIDGCWGDGAWMPALTAPQFAGHSIVYQSWGECDEPFANLYSVQPSGKNAVPVTDVAAQETQPAVSPDGNEIAFVWAARTGLSCKGCSAGIRIVSASGEPIRTLTDPPDCTFDDSPSWSPDGATILYAETGCDNPGELFTVPAAGGAPTDLHVAGVNPAWGPVRIAYQGALNTSGGIWTANPDGSDPVKIAQHGRLPAYSTTGALAYLVGKAVVWDGGAHPLPFTAVASLAWSADQTRFYVVAKTKRSASFDLYSVHLDGTHPMRLTTNYGVLGK